MAAAVSYLADRMRYQNGPMNLHRKAAAAVAMVLVAAACSAGPSEAEIQARIDAAVATNEADIDERIAQAVEEASSTATTVSEPTTVLSVYEGCAEYRAEIERRSAWFFDGTAEQLTQTEGWDDFPSPDSEGRTISIDEALDLGQHIHAMTKARLFREERETLAEIAPPEPAREAHASLLAVLIDSYDSAIDLAVVQFPSVLYGDSTGTSYTDDERNAAGTALGEDELAFERALTLATSVCPDP